MSGRLPTLWQELFGREITAVEASLLQGVDRKVGSDSPLLILASLLVRMLYVVLIESKSSPFRTLALVRRTMEEHQRSVAQISETYHVLELNLSRWNGILARTERDILELRAFARSVTLLQMITGREDHSKMAAGLGLRLLYIAWGGCFLSAGAGAFVVMVLLK
jgi:hypothetical protein